MYYNQEDIITAPATAPGKGAISIVRLSGDGCMNLLRKCLTGCPFDLTPREATLANIADEKGEFDQVIVIYYRSPKSYTGEDMVEINCHGGDYITQRVLDLLCRKGARPAEPGEFTYRAFMNGKLDLTQAEAVADLVAAESDLGNRNAARQLMGGLSEAIGGMRKELISVLAELEVELEFPDDEPMEADYWAWSERIKKVQAEIESLIRRGNTGRVIREGYKVVIAGPPNSGKSTLLNALIGEERAIVHHQAGTTRDVLREAVEIGGLKVWLMDTAGLREDGQEVEAEGIRRAKLEVENADLALYLFDLGYPSREVAIKAREVMLVGNKVDLYPQAESPAEIRISALKGNGLAELSTMIVKKALKTGIEPEVIANERHLTAMRKADACMQKALELANLEGETELMALETREALRHLGEIIGEDLAEEVLESIFSRFCIGK